METGTAARWFLRVSCVEPLAAVQVSMQDTTCASFATDSFLVFTPDPPLFQVFLIEKLQMFRGFSKYLPFPYFFTFPNFPAISPKSNNGPTLLTFFQVFLGFQRWKHPSKLSKNPRGIRVDNPLEEIIISDKDVVFFCFVWVKKKENS